jgi:hypothetical protein
MTKKDFAEIKKLIEESKVPERLKALGAVELLKY